MSWMVQEVKQAEPKAERSLMHRFNLAKVLPLLPVDSTTVMYVCTMVIYVCIQAHLPLSLPVVLFYCSTHACSSIAGKPCCRGKQALDAPFDSLSKASAP